MPFYYDPAIGPVTPTDLTGVLFGTGSLVTTADDVPVAQSIDAISGDGEPGGDTGGNAANINLSGGIGGIGANGGMVSVGGNGGAINFSGGLGGAAGTGVDGLGDGFVQGGFGGSIVFTGGIGGYEGEGINLSQSPIGGDGGSVIFTGGQGYDEDNDVNVLGGGGGALTFTAGKGGNGGNNTGGRGGTVTFMGGTGGNTLGGSPGVGGGITFTSGPGGTNGATSGNSGVISFVAGSTQLQMGTSGSTSNVTLRSGSAIDPVFHTIDSQILFGRSSSLLSTGMVQIAGGSHSGSGLTTSLYVTGTSSGYLPLVVQAAPGSANIQEWWGSATTPTVLASVGPTGGFTINQSNTSTASLLSLSSVNRTQANAEQIDINFNLSRTLTFSSGTLIATQRSFVVAPPTFASSTSKTITNAVTMEVSGSPVAGSNVTLTNQIALRVLAGQQTARGIVIQAPASATNPMLDVLNSSGTSIANIGPNGTAAFTTSMTLNASGNSGIWTFTGGNFLLAASTANLQIGVFSTPLWNVGAEMFGDISSQVEIGSGALGGTVGFNTTSAGQLRFANTTSIGTYDTGVRRISAGVIGLSNASTGNAALVCGAPTASTIGLTVKGFTSQSANLQEWQNSSGTVLGKVSKDGFFTTTNGTYSATLGYDANVGAGTLSGTSQIVFYPGSGAWQLSACAFGDFTGKTQVNSGGCNPADAGFQLDNSGMLGFGSSTANFDHDTKITRSSGAGILVRATPTTAVVATIKGAASQSGNLTEWQDSTGTVLASVSSAGVISGSGTGLTGVALLAAANSFTVGPQTLNSGATGNIALIAKGFSGQTANLQEWQDSTGAILSSVRSDGTIQVGTNANYLRLSNDGTNSYISQNANVFMFFNSDIYNTFAFGTTGVTYFLISAGTPTLRSDKSFAWSSTTNVLLSPDTLLSRSSGAGVLVTATPTTAVPLTVKGAASQAANLTEWQVSTTAVVASLSPNGLLSIIPNSTVACLSLQQSNNADVITVTKGGGSGNLLSATFTSAQSNGIVYSNTDAGTSLFNSAIYGMSSSISTGYDSYGNYAGYFVSTNTRNTAGANGGGCVGVYAKGTTTALGPVAVAGYFESGSARSIPIVAKASSGQTADLQEWQDSTGAILSKVTAAGYTFLQTANFPLAIGVPATTGTNKTNTLIAPFDGVIVKCQIIGQTAPTSQNLICDINKNGTSIWNSTQANRIQITAGSTAVATQTSFDTTAVSAGDTFTIDIDQVGSGVAGQNITVELTFLMRNT